MNQKTKLKVNLTWVPIETPDAEFRIQAFWCLLGEMIISQMVEDKRDKEQTPSTQRIVSTDTAEMGLQEGDCESKTNP